MSFDDSHVIMKHIAILGSTGSIGKSTLAVIRRHPERFSAAALTTNTSIEELYAQIKEFSPKFVCVIDRDAARKLEIKLGKSQTAVFSGLDGLKEILRRPIVDKVVLSISGSGALMPLMEAISQRKEIALANN